jgi:hypothetical protein
MVGNQVRTLGRSQGWAFDSSTFRHGESTREDRGRIANPHGAHALRIVPSVHRHALARGQARLS